MQISKTLLIGALLLVFQTTLLSADDALNPVDVEVTPLCGTLSDNFTTCGILGGKKVGFSCTDTGKCVQDICEPKGFKVDGKQVFGERKFPQGDWDKKFHFFKDLTTDDLEARKVTRKELDCYVIYSCATRCVLAGARPTCQATNNVVSRLQVTEYIKTEDKCDPNEPVAPEEPANPGDPGLLDDPNAAIIAMEPAF